MDSSYSNILKGCQPSKVPPIFNLPTKVHKRTCGDYCYVDNLIDYNHDHVKFSHIYHILYKNIQRQVQTYGAVSAYFSLYDAPFLYKRGVYRTELSKFVGHEYAKLIGREVENGVDFLVVGQFFGL
ncbi:unnamed protein product [Macrosiphum euphorbiae]|uniref:Uncharacterized protein n=1 Tax=Macrosiphum euphorbiae TaxID=13131 RepID=A0AAV0XFK4_9HEMI|nr:unnamed protein product [Macrosiphum euphorbiae]